MDGMQSLGGERMHLLKDLQGWIATASCGYVEWQRHIEIYPDIDLENPPSPICLKCLRKHQARKAE